MGSSANKPIQRASSKAGYELGRDINRVESGNLKTAAQSAFERGVTDSMNAQVGIANSGFGGNTGGRARSLDNAQADLGIQSGVARQILKDQELERLRNTKLQFDKVSAGLAADSTARDAAILSGATQTGASLIDSFSGSGQKKPPQGQQVTAISSPNNPFTNNSRSRYV